jgi:hypothetical protein
VSFLGPCTASFLKWLFPLCIPHSPLPIQALTLYHSVKVRWFEHST